MAPDVGDLYVGTRDYGAYGDVELVLPPGESAQWSTDAVDVVDGRKHVAPSGAQSTTSTR